MTAEPTTHASASASKWVARFAPLVPADAPVLDLACGAGRHVRLFRERGHPVAALDRSLDALGALARDPAVEAIEADLEDGSPWPMDGRRFGGVVVTNYLYRPILARIVAAVDRGGVLIYETFARGNERFGRPRNPDFLLHPGELLDAASGLELVAYEHGEVEQPAPAVIQRICARRPGGNGD